VEGFTSNYLQLMVEVHFNRTRSGSVVYECDGTGHPEVCTPEGAT